MIKLLWWQKNSPEMEAEAEGIVEHRSSFAAPSIFLVVITFQFLARWLERTKRVGFFFFLSRWKLFHVYVFYDSACISILNL